MADLNRKYSIILNEFQRSLIHTALLQTQLQGYYGADFDGREEVDALVRMINDLDADPDTEVTHDFTL